MKSFLLTLAIWGALFCAVWYGFHEFYYPPGDWVGAALISFFGALGIGALRKARLEGGDAALLAAPEGPPADGERVAIGGTIELLGAAVRAPLSGAECVAYDYSISHWRASRKGQSSEEIDRSGMALAPSQIRSGVRAVRLLAFPGLEDFPDSTLDGSTAQRARSYIAVTHFKDQSSIFALGEVGDLLADRSGAVRKDWKLSSHDDLDNATFKERVLPVGARACLIGRYSAAENAIVPEANVGGVRIIRGSRAEALASVRGSRVVDLVMGALLILVPSLAIWGVLAYREHYFEVNHQPSARSERAEAFFEAAKYGRVEEVRSLLRHRIDVNALDANGQPALARAADARTASALLDAGANPDAPDKDGYTPLMLAAAEGRADVVRLLIARHARLDVREPGQHRTAVAIALANDHADIAQILRDAGARAEP
jgi:hypothetical protein